MDGSYPIVRSTQLECYISETIDLSTKHAKIIKEIIYKNNSTESFSIEFKPRKLKYPLQCEYIECTINNKSVKCSVIEKDFYNEVELITESIELQPNETLKIKLNCTWNNIHNDLKAFRYSLSHTDDAKYRLKIKNLTLKDNPHVITINDDIVNDGNEYHITDNELRFEPLEIKPNIIFRIHLLILNTPEKLKILTEQNPTSQNFFSEFSIIFIQHLLSDSFHLIEAFHNFGASKEAIFIIGIPYSTKEVVVNFLKTKGFINIWTPTEYPFDNDVEEVINKAILYSKANSKKIIIVEDGGYVVPLLHRKYLHEKDMFKGAVEQTANGIWRDFDLTKVDNIELEIPVINVADSEIKSTLESPLIGRAVAKNIEILYNKTYKEITGCKVGIVGYGRTGKELARSLETLKCEITVYDNDIGVREEAKKEGKFQVSDTILDLVSNKIILIDASGKYWANDDEMGDILLGFSNGSYFFSGSSKRFGINHEILSVLSYNSKNLPGIGKVYELSNRNEITLVADGFPVNFFLGESVPDYDIAFILALLYKSAEIVSSNNIPPGIISMNDKDNDTWGLYKAQERIKKLHKLFKKT